MESETGDKARGGRVVNSVCCMNLLLPIFNEQILYKDTYANLLNIYVHIDGDYTGFPQAYLGEIFLSISTCKLNLPLSLLMFI